MIVLPYHINDEAFADRIIEQALAFLGWPTEAASGDDRATDQARG